MAITPKSGYVVDPNNPNAVIPDPTISTQPTPTGAAEIPTQPVAQPAAPTVAAPVAQPVASPPVAAQPPVIPAAKPYTVQAGDTLAMIATKFGVPIQSISGYRSGDPSKIFPGETLQIGATAAPTQVQQPVQQPTSPTAPTAIEAAPEDGDLAEMYMRAFMDSMKDPSITGPAQDPGSFLTTYGVNTANLSQGFATNPTQTVSDLVTQIMQSTQLPDAKSAITTLAKEVEDLQNARDSEFEEIDNNPFLSAGTKKARKDKIDDRYEKKIGNRTNYLKLVQDAYDSARQEAQFAATTAINLYDKNRTFDQSKLEFAVTQAEKRLETIKEMTKLNPAEFKELRGGLYNVRTNSWVVPPTEGGGGGSLGAGAGTSDLMASNLRALVAKTGPAAAIFDRAYQSAAAQSPEAASAFLRSQYLNMLSGTEREGYQNVNNGIQNYKAAIEFLEANPDLKTGFYKATAEGLKPKFLSNKDPRYSTLLNLINNAETPIRKATYGTALTPQEFTISTRSLLNTDDDREIVLQKMRENIAIYENGLDRNMAVAVGVPHVDKPVTGTGSKTAVQTGKLPNGTAVTKYSDGTISDAQGNQYDASGNRI